MKNKGMLLEQIINRTIAYYERNNLALIEKKGLPIKFKSVKEDNKVESAFIYKKSTVDYIGCVNGMFTAFEAKTINGERLPNSNILKHQLEYLKKVYEMGGIAFFVIMFSHVDEFYLLGVNKFLNFDKKSWQYEEIKKTGYKVELTFPGIIDFLPYLRNF
ncbi:Holliday junction resolvase RecU [Mycoplasma simbae]|uniref:Holliday junction resolvase RecU n=1 Tax=Mycoplasma simbae TaxID=36744 RepID=UPI000497E9D9|nr:Holliday junction resolvase RecU [Mycoplasma simbae]